MKIWQKIILRLDKKHALYGAIAAILSFFVLMPSIIGLNLGLIYILGYPFVIILQLIKCDPVRDFGCTILLGLLVNLTFSILIGFIAGIIIKKTFNKKK